MRFDQMFSTATTYDPHPFQRRIAEVGLPDVARLPMGSGKTAALVLGWLWRSQFADESVRRATPRRLVFALPVRVLVEQTAESVRTWLQRLGLEERIGMHVVMGGRRTDERTWRAAVHRPSVVIGTVDSLVSKALLRGYGVSRSMYPVDFALVTNGSHLVVDETQLAPASTATLRQVLGFARRFGTAEPLGLTCMSATVDDRVLDTVDNPARDLRVETITEEDRHGHLGRLLAATKTVRRLDGGVDDPAGFAAAILARHRPATRTLVVVNTVKTAQAVARALARLKPVPEVVLVHSRYRPVDRAEKTEQLLTPVAGHEVIVVATQVVEAGVDIDSAVLITEAAPWPSVCQRSGRCNRYAEVPDAELWWVPAGKAGPYAADDVAESERVLAGLEGRRLTGEGLLEQPVAAGDLALRIIRSPDFLTLFDTMPDLSGADLDIAPYIRDGDQLDASVGWIEVDTTGPLPADAVVPEPAWRCPVPLGGVADLVRREGVRAWTFDPATERWDRVRPAATRIRPGEVVLVHAADGGYDPDRGFDASSRSPVPLPDRGPDGDDDGGLGEVPSDAMGDDSSNTMQDGWLELDSHLTETAEQAAALIAVLGAGLTERERRSVVAAALLHDVGKYHPAWQAALRATVDYAEPPPGLLAKSPGRGRLVVDDRHGFRHELVSALALAEPGAAALLAAAGATPEDLPLVRYLVAAHHGKVRIQARETAASGGRAGQLLGLRAGETVPAADVLGQPVEEWTITLDGFALGADHSWTDDALRLLEDLGPFRLAYLETLVRISDWRASAHDDPAGPS